MTKTVINSDTASDILRVIIENATADTLRDTIKYCEQVVSLLENGKADPSCTFDVPKAIEIYHQAIEDMWSMIEQREHD